MDGNTATGIKVDLDEWFDVKLVVDATTKTETLFINGTECGSKGIKMDTSLGRCGFRFGDGGGAKFYVDDFKVTKD